MVNVLARILEYHVIKTNSAESGLELLMLETVDLIISDHKLPVLDGLDMAFLLRDKLEMASIPLILLTGMSKNRLETDNAFNSIKIMQKPFDVECLLHMVHLSIDDRYKNT